MIGTAGASLGKWARKVDANDGDPALVVDQRGTGDVLSLRDGGVVVGKVADGGAFTFSGGGVDRFRVNAAYNLTLFQATANYTLGWNDPAAARTLTIPDPLGNDTFVFLAATQTLTNKTLTAPTINGTVATTGLTLPAFIAAGLITSTVSGGAAIHLSPEGVAFLQTDRFETAVFGAPLSFRKARGSKTTPAVVVAGDNLADILAVAILDTLSFPVQGVEHVFLAPRVAEPWTATAQGRYTDFSVVTIGSTTAVVGLRITAVTGSQIAWESLPGVDGGIGILRVRDSGVGQVEVGRWVGAADPYLQMGPAAGYLRVYGTGTDHIEVMDATNIKLGATTGTKIGTATTQKLGFYNATPVVQGASVADATGGATIDAEARTAINALISRIEATGLIATV